MKLETRIELIILLVGAILIGGWIGVRLARSKSRHADEGVTATQTTRPATRIMRAPPAATPAAQPSGRTASRPPAARPATRTAAPTSTRTTPPRTGSGRMLITTTQSPPATPSKPAGTKPDPGLARAKALLAEGKTFEARAVLTRLIFAAPEGERREELARMLAAINKKLFFSRAPSPDSTFYAVRKGDTLWAITKRFSKDLYFSGLIMKINGIQNPKRIRPGQRLKIPQGDFSAVCQKRAHRLTLFLNGHYVKEYPVAVGTPTMPTPEGRFLVGTKKTEPDWYAPNGNLYKHGDRGNILGSRWIALKDTPEYQGYGIHGTTQPDSIGKDVSNGCIRMHNADVEEVFGMLMSGNVVTVLK